MATEEATFLGKYKNNLDKLFSNLALSHIPERAANFSKFGEITGKSDQIDPPMPNINAAIFVKAEENIRGVFVEGLFILLFNCHRLIRGVLIQSCSAGARNFTKHVFFHVQFSGLVQNSQNYCAISKDIY